MNWLLDRGLKDSIGVHEEVFLDATEPSRQMLRNAGWWAESAWTLAWVLGWTRDLGPLEQVSHEMWFDMHIYQGDTASQIATAKLRDGAEIAEQLAILRRLEEMSNLARIMGGVNKDVLFERLRALIWVTEDHTDWDHVYTEFMPKWH